MASADRCTCSHHEFLEDIVLNRPGELGGRHALLLGRNDIEREHRQNRAAHRHRHGYLVERYARKKAPHVVNRIDRDAGHADVRGNARMIRIIATMGRKVESNRKPLLPGGEIAAVEGIRLFGARVARILPDGPRPLDIHGGVRAAHIRRDAGETIEAIEPGNVACAVDRRDAYALGS